MSYYIQARRPLSLQDLLPTFMELTGKKPAVGASFLGTEISQLAEDYRTGSAEWWEREKQALSVLLQITEGPEPVYLSPLLVPTRFPAEWSGLLSGLSVNFGEYEERLSPLVLIWLKQIKASTSQPFPATVEEVAVGEGVAIMRLSENAGNPLSTREQHDHLAEHIDESMVLVQANIDDATPEWLGYTMERLLKAGANDVNLIPLTMKKSRQASMLQVLCYQSALDMIKLILFRETTTFGLRYFPVACHRLARRFHKVATSWGEVFVKLGYLSQERVQIAPEFEDCAKLAAQHGVPLKRIYQEAVEIAADQTPAWL